MKSAFFGTPAPQEETTLYEVEKTADKLAVAEKKQLLPNFISPTKPQGILLTPGTGTTRRKTVSFGTEVLDNEGKEVAQKIPEKNGTAIDSLGKLPAPWTSKMEPLSQPSRKTALTRTLENARDAKARKDCSAKTHDLPTPQSLSNMDIDADQHGKDIKSEKKFESKSQTTNQNLLQNVVHGNDFDGDMTMDLNDPHSLSGKYWKSEFEKYHEEARAEMQKLVKYKQMAKSYAKKKDAEALDLAEKLKEEQRKVTAMEDNISKLVSQIATEEKDDENDDASSELIRELARQSALAMQYRLQVEEFRAALEGKHGQGLVADKWNSLMPAGKENRHSATSGEDSREINSLREEMQKLREDLLAAGKANHKLQEENNKLAQDLLHSDLRLDKHTEKCEKRRQSLEEQRQKKDEALQSLQKDYDTFKEQAKSQRRDAEHLLKRRHDQVVSLKQEIALMKGAESTTHDLEKALKTQDLEHHKVVEGYRNRISQLEQTIIDLKSTKAGKEEKKEFQLKNEASKPTPSGELRLRESNIPVPSQPISSQPKILAPLKSIGSETPFGPPLPRSPHATLSEIANNSSVERLVFQRSKKVERTPVVNRYSEMPQQPSAIDLPSNEPSSVLVASRVIHERTCHNSPASPTLNIPSSPPKLAIVRPRVTEEAPGNKLGNELAERRQANNGSSRLLSIEASRARNTLPPERFAAAKARLEQKLAEKKRAQGLGVEKENIRN